MKFSGWLFPCSKNNSSQLTALLILMSLMIFACFHLEKHDLFCIHGQLFVLNAEPKKNTMQWSYQNERDDPMALGREKTCETCKLPTTFSLLLMNSGSLLLPTVAFASAAGRSNDSCLVAGFVRQKKGLWSLRAKQKKIGSGKSSAAFCTWQGLVASESHTLTFFSMAFRFTWMENYDSLLLTFTFVWI